MWFLKFFLKINHEHTRFPGLLFEKTKTHLEQLSSRTSYPQTRKCFPT